MMGIDPVTHRPRTDLNLLANLPNLLAAAANLNNFATNPLMINSLHLQKFQLMQTLIQSITNVSPFPNNMDAVSSLLGSSFGLHNLNQTPMGFSNSGIQHLPSVNLQALLGSNGTDLVAPMNYGSCNSSEFGTTSTSGTTTSFMSTPATNSTPSLVSASPENHTVNQAPELVNPADVSSGSPTSTPFEPWSGLTLDDLDSDLGWKEILE